MKTILEYIRIEGARPGKSEIQKADRRQLLSK